MLVGSPFINSDSYLCNCFVHIPPFFRSCRHHRRDTRHIRGPSDALCTFTRVPLTIYLFQAFVIYNFFHLLLAYLGGERSLLILLHGRPPKDHLFPGRCFPFHLTRKLNLSVSLHLQARDGRLRSIHLPLAQTRHTTWVMNHLLCATSLKSP